MSLVGKIPFVHTFTPFATRRVYDQVYLSGAYQKANVRIFGSDPGFWASHNGGTHTSVEDVALMRAIPTITVLAPADATAMKWVVEETSKHYECFIFVQGVNPHLIYMMLHNHLSWVRRLWCRMGKMVSSFRWVK